MSMSNLIESRRPSRNGQNVLNRNFFGCIMLSWNTKRFDYRNFPALQCELKRVSPNVDLYPQDVFKGIGGVIPYSCIALREIVSKPELSESRIAIKLPSFQLQESDEFPAQSEYAQWIKFVLGTRIPTTPKMIFRDFTDDLFKKEIEFSESMIALGFSSATKSCFKPCVYEGGFSFDIIVDIVSTYPDPTPAKYSSDDVFMFPSSISKKNRAVLPPNIDEMIVSDIDSGSAYSMLWDTTLCLIAFYLPLSQFRLHQAMQETFSAVILTTRDISSSEKCDVATTFDDTNTILIRANQNPKANLSTISRGLSWLDVVSIHYSNPLHASHSPDSADLSSFLDVSNYQDSNSSISVETSRGSGSGGLGQDAFHAGYFSTLYDTFSSKNKIFSGVRTIIHGRSDPTMMPSLSLTTIERLIGGQSQQLLYIPNTGWSAKEDSSSRTSLYKWCTRSLNVYMESALNLKCIFTQRRVSCFSSGPKYQPFEEAEGTINFLMEDEQPEAMSVKHFPVHIITRRVENLPVERLWGSKREAHCTIQEGTNSAQSVSSVSVGIGEKEKCDMHECGIRSSVSRGSEEDMDNVDNGVKWHEVWETAVGEDSRTRPIPRQSQDQELLVSVSSSMNCCTVKKQEQHRCLVDKEGSRSAEGNNWSESLDVREEDTSTITHRQKRVYGYSNVIHYDEDDSALDVKSQGLVQGAVCNGEGSGIGRDNGGEVMGYQDLSYANCSTAVSTSSKDMAQENTIASENQEGVMRSFDGCNDSGGQEGVLDDMVHSFLDMHAVDTSIHTVARTKRVQGVVNDRETSSSRDQPISRIPVNMSSSSSSHEMKASAVAGLRILISEDLVVKKPTYATLLSRKHKFISHVAPLEAPVGFIVDELTGVAILTEAVLVDKSQFKIFLKQLTSQVFKFGTIWLLVVKEDTASRQFDCSFASISDAMISLCQCLCQFPCEVVLRQTSDCMVTDLVHRVCEDAAAPHSRDGILASWYQQRRGMLLLSNPVFSAHCEFLQLFPSINFFLAVKILTKWKLRELPCVREDELRDELPLHCSRSVERFVRLLHVPFRG